jgi:hypothetical protein
MNPDLSEELNLPQRFAAFFFLPQSLFPLSTVTFEYFCLLAGWIALRVTLLLFFLTLLTFLHQLILERTLRHVHVFYY